jgi:hypothetical protein
MTGGDHDGARAVRIRPYLLTGGRTESAVDLQLESQVRTTEAGQKRAPGLDHERREIVSLCVEPQSLAEVSAHVGIHLQVARILLGDLIDEGLVATGAASQQSQQPDLRLLERVLDGLQSL